MALVLRKAVLPKNASFLKCLKGRTLATVTNKKNTAPISKAAPLRAMRPQPQKVVPDIQLISVRTMMQQKEDVCINQCPVHKSFSCPCFSRGPHFETATLSRTRSESIMEDLLPFKLNFQPSLSLITPQSQYSTCSKTPLAPLDTLDTSNEIKEIYSVCACPSGCCCLPPPCNQPAKCLQNITGYYYYPYGTWFCGPYHIKTGPCGPCAGPVQPGGPCGPAPPNPGGPCGPAGVVLCEPGGNCAPSCSGPCACAPCRPFCNCAVCSCEIPRHCVGPCGPCGPCHDPYSPCGLTGACAPCGLCGSYSICNGPSGPCYNIPCVPIQVCGPVRPGGPCGPKLASNPFNLCTRYFLCRPDEPSELNPSTTTNSMGGFDAPNKMNPDIDDLTSCSESVVLKSLSEPTPSRINVYPKLAGNSSNIYEPIAKLHQSTLAHLSHDQIRTFTTMIRTTGKLTNDLLTSKTKSNEIVAANTVVKCCKRTWGCYCPRCDCNVARPLCPPLCQPRYIPTKEERDAPYIPPNCFSYCNTPTYRNPSPYTDVIRGVYCGQPWS